MRHFATALLLLAGAASSRLHAQASPAPAVDAAPPKHWCFRGRPKPDCDIFWLTEFGVAARLSDNYQSGNYPSTFDLGKNFPLVTWELGWMANRGTRNAFGAAFFAQVGTNVSAIGIRPRYRRWLGGTTSLDIAPGLVLKASNGVKHGFSGDVALNFTSATAITVNLLAFPPSPYLPNQRTHVALFAGGRLGAVPGAVVGPIFGVGLLALIVLAIGGAMGG